MTTQPFNQTLLSQGIRLVREQTATLQVNLGFLCNQTCRHCHLSAGPGRRENMDSETVREVISYARRSHFEVIDITGGAPELNPNLVRFIEEISPLASRIMLRSNLSALNDGKRDYLRNVFKSHRVIIVASFPSLNEAQADSQRGKGIFEKSIDALRKLNAMGYGKEGTGLKLNLVSNPTGAFLPPSQTDTEKRFRKILDKKWGIVFNNLFSFANVPLGRFREWLVMSGNFDRYMDKLFSAFNPCAIDKLMCRTLVSVSIFMIVILIWPGGFVWEDRKSIYPRCRDLRSRAVILLWRIIVIPARPDPDSHEAEPLRPELQVKKKTEAFQKT
ncbi:arsenosugar biosynthesis radical SAM (seleno)protein ArsS [Desulfonema magnum]